MKLPRNQSFERRPTGPPLVANKTGSPEIEITVGGNSSLVTINVTVQEDGKPDDLLSTAAILPTMTNTLARSIPTSSAFPPSTDQTGSAGTIRSAGSVGSSNIGISTATFNAETTSSLSNALTSVPGLPTGLTGESPFTSSSSGSPVPLIIVILRTLFG